MILFIHGIHQSAGIFLPLIRSMFGNSNNIDDKYLLDSFCLWVPGYDKKDIDFDYKYIEDEIYEFISQKKEIQKEIANKLLLSDTNLPIKIIKDSKLNLIGCDIGAGVALDFAAQNPEVVSSIIMIDCGMDLKTLRSKWMLIQTNRLLSQPASTIIMRYQSETDIYKKIFLSSVANFPSAKGIKSYLELFRSYNFNSTFNKISIDKQKELSQVKILNFVDKKLGLSNNSSTKKLQNILNKKFSKVSKRSVFIKFLSHQNLNIQTVSIGKKSILNQQVADSITEKIKLFYL